jgi:hypothetical protein
MTAAPFVENILGIDTIQKSIRVVLCATSKRRDWFPVTIAGLDIENRNLKNVMGVFLKRNNSPRQMERN